MLISHQNQNVYLLNLNLNRNHFYDYPIFINQLDLKAIPKVYFDPLQYQTLLLPFQQNLNFVSEMGNNFSGLSLISGIDAALGASPTDFEDRDQQWV